MISVQLTKVGYSQFMLPVSEVINKIA